ncbi:MAG: cold-shock protein [Vicinamibacterales bacterium]
MAEAVCVECSYPFRYDAEYFASRALQPPRRCKRCRDERRATRPPAGPRETGTVVQIIAHAGYGFLAPAAGGDGDVYLHRADCAVWPLPLGAVVEFERRPDEHVIGRRPRARCVVLLAAAEAAP